MLVRLDNPDVLSRAIELISELVTEVRIKVNEFGFSITAMDPANVSMVGFKLPKSEFSVFELGNEKETLGVNLEDLKRILKRAGKGSVIIDKQDTQLKIQIDDRIKRNFILSLVDIDSEEIDFSEKISRMEFVSHVEINSNDLIDSIEDMSVVADACGLALEEGKFIIEAKELNSARAEFSSDEANLNGEASKSRYSLEYLQKFIKASKLNEKTFLSFSSSHPLKFSVKNEHFELSFILAPRIENDD